jgi:hypothetical protein
MTIFNAAEEEEPFFKLAQPTEEVRHLTHNGRWDE